MNKLKNIYKRLTDQGIKSNKEIYLPYIIVNILLVSLFYIFHYLSYGEELRQVPYFKELQIILRLGVFILALFSLIFLYYTRQFVNKRRSKEFALYQVFGMEKKHLAKLMTYESIVIYLVSLLVGLLSGVAFYRLFELLLIRMLASEFSGSAFYNSNSLLVTSILFLVINLVIYISSVLKISKFTPKALMEEAKAGQKQPKANVLYGIFGIISLGIGYYLAITLKNPLSSIQTFLIAVIFVMIGTYASFTSASIMILNALKKNRRYFYKKDNFTAVSGLIYRMKQNATGLANICIMSTAVLVLLTTSFALYMGLEENLDKMSPRDILITYNKDIETNKAREFVDGLIKEYDIEAKDMVKLKTFVLMLEKDKDNYLGNNMTSLNDNLLSGQEIRFVALVNEEEAKKTFGTDLKLEEGQVATYNFPEDFKQNDIELQGGKFDIVSNSKLPVKNPMPVQFGTISYIVMKQGDINTIASDITSVSESVGVLKSEIISFNYPQEDQEKIDKLVKKFTELGVYYAKLKTEERAAFKALYTGLLFVGLFLGGVFIIGTGLNIYYKQITEGYEDRDNFKKYRRVGMNEEEVQATIKSQVRTVFLLPIITAGIHIFFAMFIIRKLIGLFGLDNIQLQNITCATIYVLFSVFYFVMFKITSRKYYQIVTE